MRTHTIQTEVNMWTRHVNEVSSPILDYVVRSLVSHKTEYVNIESRPAEGPSLRICFKIVPWDEEDSRHDEPLVKFHEKRIDPGTYPGV